LEDVRRIMAGDAVPICVCVVEVLKELGVHAFDVQDDC
jgi:hypothetical protein